VVGEISFTSCKLPERRQKGDEQSQLWAQELGPHPYELTKQHPCELDRLSGSYSGLIGLSTSRVIQ
jgi:hypothetical protein